MEGLPIHENPPSNARTANVIDGISANIYIKHTDDDDDDDASSVSVGSETPLLLSFHDETCLNFI